MLLYRVSSYLYNRNQIRDIQKIQSSEKVIEKKLKCTGKIVTSLAKIMD